MSETTKWIFATYGIESFGSYWFSVTHILYEAEIKFTIFFKYDSLCKEEKVHDKYVSH